MPRFQIKPIDQSVPTAEIIVPDAARVLAVVERLSCQSADVLRDGEYAFSIQLNSTGMWSIFQRTGYSLGEVPALAG